MRRCGFRVVRDVSPGGRRVDVRHDGPQRRVAYAGGAVWSAIGQCVPRARRAAGDRRECDHERRVGGKHREGACARQPGRTASKRLDAPRRASRALVRRGRQAGPRHALLRARSPLARSRGARGRSTPGWSSLSIRRRARAAGGIRSDQAFVLDGDAPLPATSLPTCRGASRSQEAAQALARRATPAGAPARVGGARKRP